MTRTLSFRIATSVYTPQQEPWQAVAPLPYFVVTVRPVCDGLPLAESGDVFDVITLLCHGAVSAEFDLYTCSCGVAGCAGIFEQVQLVIDGDTASWTFPEEPFRKYLNVALCPADEPLTVLFSRAQYEQALIALEADLLALDETNTLPLMFPPGDPPEDERTFATMMALVRKRSAAWKQEQADRHELFGPLLKEQVHVEFTDGRRFYMDVISLAHAHAELLREANDSEGDSKEALSDTVVPSYLADREAVLAFARSQPWSLMDDHCYRDIEAEGGVAVTVEYPEGVEHGSEEAEALDQPLWATAKLSVAPLGAPLTSA